MATKADIITIARNYLRDFPQFFQVDFTPSGRTYQVGQTNIDKTSLWVATVVNNVPTVVAPTGYDVDERGGYIRFKTDVSGANSILIEGQYFDWLTTGDMEFYAEMAIDLHLHNLNVALANLAPAVEKVIGINTLVQALWGLLSEYSRDIDVITSESIHIPASQRFRMVQSLLEYWEAEYRRLAQALNIGLDRIEVLTLRRRSHLTERLVPIYKEREIGDYGPIERLWPELDNGVISITTEEDDLREEVYVDGPPPEGYYINAAYYPGPGAGYY